MERPSRRVVAIAGVGGALSALTGCASLPDLPIFGVLTSGFSREGQGPLETPDYAQAYGRVEGEKHPVPAFDYTVMDPSVLRADVAYGGPEPPGTIVVDPRRHLLFLVGPNRRATRYGVAVGRESKGFFGEASVAMRREWPDWAPSPVTAARVRSAWAQLRETPAGRTIPGGPKNPRGARALYLGSSGRDAGYVIHGTPNPSSVGTDVAEGCIALINQDVIDLYARSAEGTRAVILP